MNANYENSFLPEKKVLSELTPEGRAKRIINLDIKEVKERLGKIRHLIDAGVENDEIEILHGTSVVSLEEYIRTGTLPTMNMQKGRGLASNARVGDLYFAPYERKKFGAQKDPYESDDRKAARLDAIHYAGFSAHDHRFIELGKFKSRRTT